VRFFKQLREGLDLSLKICDLRLQLRDVGFHEVEAASWNLAPVTTFLLLAFVSPSPAFLFFFLFLLSSFTFQDGLFLFFIFLLPQMNPHRFVSANKVAATICVLAGMRCDTAFFP